MWVFHFSAVLISAVPQFSAVPCSAASQFSAVPISAVHQFSAVIIACHDLVCGVQSTALSRDGAGSHFGAVIVVWHGTAPLRHNDRSAVC